MKAGQDFDCLVVGAGLAGLTTAIEIARSGVPTGIIYDECDRNYASKATHGISTIKGILESDANLFGLKLEGHRGFEKWLSGVEHLCGLSRPPGVWLPGVEENFASLEHFKKEFGRIYRKDFIGAKRVEWLMPAHGSFASVRYPGDWWVDPKYLIGTYRQALGALQVKALTGSVKSVSQTSRGALVGTKDGRQMCARVVILCTGPGTTEVLNGANISLNEPLFAVPGYTFEARSKTNRRLSVVKGTSGVTQLGSKVFWGSTSESARHLLDIADFQRLTPEAEESMATKSLGDLFADFNSEVLSDIKARWGIRVRTRGRAPVVRLLSQSDQSAIWLNTGYYKSGIILSWFMAQRLAGLIAAGPPYSSNH